MYVCVHAHMRNYTIKFANFDITGIFRYEFVPTGRTFDQVYYLEVLKRLREKVRRKRP